LSLSGRLSVRVAMRWETSRSIVSEVVAMGQPPS
jgi:hypothetical protein